MTRQTRAWTAATKKMLEPTPAVTLLPVISTMAPPVPAGDLEGHEAAATTLGMPPSHSLCYS